MLQLQPRLIARAVEIAGSAQQLAARLGVDEHAVRLWQTSRATPPQQVFLELVDFILMDDIARAAQDRRREPRTQLTVIDARV
jgi:ribosome-binding protein aMBF1 (putative translation factor)